MEARKGFVTCANDEFGKLLPIALNYLRYRAYVFIENIVRTFRRQNICSVFLKLEKLGVCEFQL